MAEFPPAATLPSLTLYGGTPPAKEEISKAIGDWLMTLQQRLEQKPRADIADLFVEEAWWRDIIGLYWDFHTRSGIPAITSYLNESKAEFGKLEVIQHGGLAPKLEVDDGLHFIQAGFTFKTKFGGGRGIIRMANVAPQEWKAWTVSTQLEDLNGKNNTSGGEPRGLFFPDESPVNGAMNGHTNGDSNGTTNGDTNDEHAPVVIVGAGHSGLALGAHLKNLGVHAIIMERGPKVGNAWAERYESVRTHTITPGDYLPFLKHPSNWPSWQDKAHITGWLENYARIMGLEVRLNTMVEKAQYDEASRKWTVQVRHGGRPKSISANHIVMALGMAGPEAADLDLPGKETFKGLAYHAAAHKSAATIPHLNDKNVVIVGCATTAHDMAQDFVNHGAKSVSMIQRQPTWSFSGEAIKKYHLGHFTEPGVSTDEADLLINSLPTAVARVFGYSMTQEMIRHDKELLDKLEEVGMKIKRGEDGTSFIDYLFFRGGHFYVDQGATPMILDGRIKVRMCSEGVREYCPDGLVLGDGSKISADVVCVATGFKPSGTQLKHLMGEDVWAKACRFGSFNEELERRGWWRPTGFPGFWYMCGTFSWSRPFSSVMALQIAALEQGLVDEYWENKHAEE